MKGKHLEKIKSVKLGAFSIMRDMLELTQARAEPVTAGPSAMVSFHKGHTQNSWGLLKTRAGLLPFHLVNLSMTP